jgi:hypothetical protein
MFILTQRKQSSGEAESVCGKMDLVTIFEWL